MDEDVRLDKDWLRVMLLHFKESISDRDDISLISFCLDDTEESISFPGGKYL